MLLEILCLLKFKICKVCCNIYVYDFSCISISNKTILNIIKRYLFLFLMPYLFETRRELYPNWRFVYFHICAHACMFDI